MKRAILFLLFSFALSHQLILRADEGTALAADLITFATRAAAQWGLEFTGEAAQVGSLAVMQRLGAAGKAAEVLYGELSLNEDPTFATVLSDAVPPLTFPAWPDSN